ncbi:MAG: PAS domain-containing protein, partial [Gammaproteobacteria bacterium]|nr:PAS domain-containing protein [Gammaproteobacteria bacterium]
FQDVFGDAPVAMALVSPEGKFITANKLLCQTLGYSATELDGTPSADIIHSDDLPYRDAAVQSLLDAEPHNNSCEVRLRHKSGSTIQVSIHQRLVRDAAGNPDYLICRYDDITRHKENAHRHKLLETRYNLSQRHANFGVWDWDIQTNDLYWSEQIGPLIGYSDVEVDANYADFITATHPDDRAYVSEAVRAAVEDAAPYDIEHRVVWPDGTVRWVRETGDVIRAADGTPLNMIGVAQDITRRHEADEAVKHNAAQLKQAQAIAHMGHWSWDVDSGTLQWSDEIYRIFGYEPGEFAPTYEKFIAALHPEDVTRIKESEKTAFAEGRPHSIDHRIIRPNGTEAWVHEEAIAVLDEKGKAIQLTGTVQDITERKHLEQQLADKIEQAEAANFAKSTFLSHMSHELRTPLNAILGFAQILAMEHQETPAAQGIKEILSSGWHLLELVDDLLDLSRVETDAIELAIKPVSVNSAIQDCQAMVESLLTERGIRFIPTFLNGNYSVYADRRRFKQIILNLLSNAAKYNREGGIIEVTSQQKGNQIRIAVRDTGQGIPEAMLPRLFTPFDRLGKEGIEESGTGIGLTLVKRLTQKMNGKIGVTTNAGAGSTFWIEFPAFQESDLTKSQQLQKNIQGNARMQNNEVRVLCIEDNRANMHLIESFFATRKNVRLYTATTATAGLDIARQQQPDIILMDIKLPDINGYEALAHLQASTETSHIPVIAVSAIAHVQDVAAGLKAGFKSYLTKPLNLKELEKAMHKAIQEAGSNDDQGFVSEAG